MYSDHFLTLYREQSSSENGYRTTMSFQYMDYCYPINYSVDLTALRESVTVLLSRLGLDLYNINYNHGINLTHLPHLEGDSRWGMYFCNHSKLKALGINEADFTELLAEASDLYIGEVIRKVYAYHKEPFVGRVQLIWLEAGGSYGAHRDRHITARYHVPIFTDENCYWEFGEEKKKLHMPADGRVWHLAAADVTHDFLNKSDITRLHLVISNSI